MFLKSCFVAVVVVVVLIHSGGVSVFVALGGIYYPYGMSVFILLFLSYSA